MVVKQPEAGLPAADRVSLAVALALFLAFAVIGGLWAAHHGWTSGGSLPFDSVVRAGLV